MAKSARLKVFAARIGFYDTVVAAPSQKAALEAWGVHRNLFQEGGAAPTEDPDAVEAALASPGVVLRRALGSTEPYAAEASAAGVVLPDAAPKKRDGKAAAPAPRPPPDRSALDAAESAAAELEREHEAERREIARLRADLDDRERRQEEAYERRRKAVTRDLDRARREYQRALGDR
jgi:hypothetical protein